MISRIDAIEIIAEHTTADDLVISTTGMISRELFVSQDRANNFYMLGSMGLASSLGLGLAVLNPTQRIFVLEGDGSALMSMGTMALVASESPADFVHIVLDNECYESTGGQPTISHQIDLAKIAEGCGYKHVAWVEDRENLTKALDEVEAASSPHFILVKVGVAPVDGIPRVSHTPKEIRDRFKAAVKTTHTPLAI